MLFRHWDAWRRRRAEAYLALTPEQRFRKHQWHRVAAFITLPGIVLGTASVAAAYGSGAFHRETATCTPQVVQAPSRGSFKVSVLNATGRPGLATTVGKELARRDFRIVQMTTAPSDLYVKSSGMIYYGAAGEHQALLLQKQLPGSVLFNDGRTGTAVALVIGSGYAKLAYAPPPQMPLPSAVTVNVYNTTYHEGLAKKVQDELAARGFKKGKAGNDPEQSFLPSTTAVIRYGADGDLAAKRLAQHVPGAKLEKDDRSGTRVDLVIGSTFTALTPADEVPPLPVATKTAPETVAVPCESGS